MARCVGGEQLQNFDVTCQNIICLHARFVVCRARGGYGNADSTRALPLPKDVHVAMHPIDIHSGAAHVLFALCKP